MRYLFSIVLWAAVAVPMPGHSIPRTTGTLLSGQPIVLPTDLTAKRTVLIVGFSEKSADSVTEWGKEIRTMIAVAPSLAGFELPVLASVPRLIRSIVVRSMKKGLPTDLQATFLPVFENETAWKQLAGFNAPDDAYVLVVDSVGLVLWKTHGAPTRERLQQLREAVAER